MHYMRDGWFFISYQNCCYADLIVVLPGAASWPTAAPSCLTTRPRPATSWTPTWRRRGSCSSPRTPTRGPPTSRGCVCGPPPARWPLLSILCTLYPLSIPAAARLGVREGGGLPGGGARWPRDRRRGLQAGVRGALSARDWAVQDLMDEIIWILEHSHFV